MNELIPLALQNTEDGFDLYDEIPFDLTEGGVPAVRRGQGDATARDDRQRAGRPLADIDIDYSPLQLEDTFADEDRKALAGSA